ncbi:hypothetical protein PAHAL_5G309700 [Panicum hallii]|uniref:BHLH domain-containing protein n=1 Tax=Panicum hallii TaxID=206008 RepID=A0A2S3HVB1_9POAL|nr:uncharacterized protein LOC112894950 [Panicum hallii]PAN30644.1 hypothetical protein PAHAL_5G309700 [Panicum hallii]
MAAEHPLALSLAGGRTKGSPAGTTTVALAPPEQRQAMVEIERARRRHMSRLYAELGALLPDLPPRAPKARILEEAIAYVGALRGTVAKLEAPGAVEGAGRRTAAVAAEVLAAEKASCFAARLPAARRPGALTRVLEVFRRYGVPVLAATVTSNAGEAAVTVTTGAVAPSVVEGIKADISRSIA